MIHGPNNVRIIFVLIFIFFAASTVALDSILSPLFIDPWWEFSVVVMRTEQRVISLLLSAAVMKCGLINRRDSFAFVDIISDKSNSLLKEVARFMMVKS